LKCQLLNVSVFENLSKAFVSPSAVWLNPGSLKRSGLQFKRQERLIWLEMCGPDHR
jgi:hypothetical protein